MIAVGIYWDSLRLGAENHAKHSVEDGKFRPIRLHIAGKS